MKTIITILIVFAACFNLNAQQQTHIVQQDETIYSISKKYLVTVFDLYALNPKAKEKLLPNMVLIIPNSKVKNEPIPETQKEVISYKKHKVRRKETLYSISKKYNIEIEDIKKANRYLYSENLRKGDRIQIPRFKIVQSQQTLNNTIKIYKVKPKEGKWRVAYKFGITIAELEALNPNMKAVLQIGDELNVPNIAYNEEKPTSEAYNYYEVLPKEGFYRLKLKLGLTQDELETLNPELKEGGLKAGMVLKIPLNVQTPNNVNIDKPVNLKDRLYHLDTKKLALMMPYKLHLLDVNAEEDTKEKIKKDKLLTAVLDFHEGVLMALDSAKQLGISTNLKVLDTRYQPAMVARHLATHDLSDYDAVIGPMETQSFDKVATALKPYQVPVIAAMTKPKNVRSNVFQTLPEDAVLEKAMIDFVKRDSLKSKIVIIADRAHITKAQKLKQEFPTAKVLYSRRNKKGKDEGFIYEATLKAAFQPGKTIVFLETNLDFFASSIVSMLNGISVNNKEIILVTTDKNKAFDSDKINNNLSNLQFHYPFVNRPLPSNTQSPIIKAYKNAHFGAQPSRYVLRGFDITLDILLRLAATNSLYNEQNQNLQTEHLENKFNYTKTGTNGYVNQAVYIVKYKDLTLVEAKSL